MADVEVLDHLITTVEAAKLLGVKPKTLRQQVRQGVAYVMPYRRKVGKRWYLLWDRRELAADLKRAPSKDDPSTPSNW